jgi:hypothetical protein
MAVTVKQISLWRREIDNRPGALAETLEPLSGTDLQAVMAYRYPNNTGKGAVEVYPIATKKAVAAAQSAGLAESGIPALLVMSDNKPGMGHASAQAIADAGINLAFLMAQVVGRKYSAVFGFDTDVDCKKASGLIKRVHAAGRKRS